MLAPAQRQLHLACQHILLIWSSVGSDESEQMMCAQLWQGGALLPADCGTPLFIQAPCQQTEQPVCCVCTGWILFLVFAGWGFFAAPIDWIFQYIRRPKSVITKSEYIDRARGLAQRAKEIKVCMIQHNMQAVHRVVQPEGLLQK